MKIAIFAVLLCALQATLVSARTFDDITTDFSKYIGDFHTTLAKESHFLLQEEDGRGILADYDRDSFMLGETFDRKLSWIYHFIESAVQNIILETSMSDHPDLIEHCQDTRQSEFRELLDIAAANKRVCTQIGLDGKSKLEAIINEIINRQSPVHNKLETIIPGCTASSTTNSQLVSCLVENLYDKMAPEMAQIMKGMRDDVANMSVKITEKLNGTQTCYTISSNEAEGTMNNIINSFRSCCVAASPGAH